MTTQPLQFPASETWTQANAIIRRHFELYAKLPAFPAEAADELTDALAGLLDKVLAEQRERIAQAIEAMPKFHQAVDFRTYVPRADVIRMVREMP